MQTVILNSKPQRDAARHLIDCAPVGAIVTVREAKRTTDQNAKFWALLSDISRSKPDGRHATPEVWKSLMMHACGHAVQFELGINGQPFPVGFRSSQLTKSEMADLITFAIEYGDSKGVVWTDPNMEQAA